MGELILATWEGQGVLVAVDHEAASQGAAGASLDHLIRPLKERRRDGEADRLGVSGIRPAHAPGSSSMPRPRVNWSRCLETLGHEVVVTAPNFAPMHAKRTGSPILRRGPSFGAQRAPGGNATDRAAARRSAPPSPRHGGLPSCVLYLKLAADGLHSQVAAVHVFRVEARVAQLDGGLAADMEAVGAVDHHGLGLV